MMKTYSHIRRQALDQAAAALEPPFKLEPLPLERIKAPSDLATSQSTSQSPDLAREARDFLKEVGSSGWIRTSNPPVNSRMLYR